MKFSSLEKNDPLRLRILTILPDSWSERKICREFNASRHCAKNAKTLKSEAGVLGERVFHYERKLAESVTEKVIKFFCDDANSRIMPSTKDTVTMKTEEGPIKMQKRLLLLPLKELHVLYKEKYKEDAVGFSTFAKLRPKYCILPLQSGTHSVCVCTIHQNMKLMVDAIDFKSFSDCTINDYIDCLKKSFVNYPRINVS